MKITILVDNESWILPYVSILSSKINELGHKCSVARKKDEIGVGDLCFIIGCVRLLPQEYLDRNAHNLVVHESKLPKGRGFAPVAWQIIEGKNIIPMSLLEASENADEGDIWLEDEIVLDGTELLSEWRDLQGLKTIELCVNFVSKYPNLIPRKQKGSATYYSRRTPTDSKLDPDKSLREQFALLRTVDNINYPAFFEIDGTTYQLSIYKTADDDFE